MPQLGDSHTLRLRLMITARGCACLPLRLRLFSPIKDGRFHFATTLYLSPALARSASASRASARRRFTMAIPFLTPSSWGIPGFSMLPFHATCSTRRQRLASAGCRWLPTFATFQIFQPLGSWSFIGFAAYLMAHLFCHLVMRRQLYPQPR